MDSHSLSICCLTQKILSKGAKTLSVLKQIASLQGRRDDEPNKQLAKSLVANLNEEGIQEIVENLTNEDLAVQSDCIKVLYEIGYLNPSLIAEYWQVFLNLLDSKNNRLVWGGMIALSTITSIKADALYPHREKIIHAVTKGSVITRDSGVKTLAVIGSVCEEYRKDVFPFLMDLLKTCRPKDVARYAETMLAAVDINRCDEFIHLLQKRILSLTDSQVRRIRKVITTAEKIDQAG